MYAAIPPASLAAHRSPKSRTGSAACSCSSAALGILGASRPCLCNGNPQGMQGHEGFAKTQGTYMEGLRGSWAHPINTGGGGVFPCWRQRGLRGGR